MRIEKFVECMIDDINSSKQAFIDNLNYLNTETAVGKEHTFCEWMEIFGAWMEWSTDRCNDMYEMERLK